MSTYVIADIGANHDSDPVQALRAVDIAADIGVDMLKFQWTSNPIRMADRRGRAREDGYADIYRRYLAMPIAWHMGLFERCRKAGIDYGCTVFLPEDVKVVAPFVAKFKIASFEAEDTKMLEAHLPYRDKTLIVSAGMLEDGPAIGGVRGWCVTERFDVAILRCVSAYPAPHETLQLNALWEEATIPTHTSKRCYAGLSDHTHPSLTWTGALAVAAGASIVEAHLRLDDTDVNNPDYPHAMSPPQFADYVKHIRFAEACVGDRDAGLQECERAMLRYKVGM